MFCVPSCPRESRSGVKRPMQLLATREYLNFVRPARHGNKCMHQGFMVWLFPQFRCHISRRLPVTSKLSPVREVPALALGHISLFGTDWLAQRHTDSYHACSTVLGLCAEPRLTRIMVQQVIAIGYFCDNFVDAESFVLGFSVVVHVYFSNSIRHGRQHHSGSLPTGQ